MSEEIETRIIVIAPTSEITPDHITRFVHGLEFPITVKETCFGVMIEGERTIVRKVLEAVRKLDPYRICSKIRGFPLGDTRRCRAHHGSRPGFTQLEKEWEALSIVSKGLESIENREEFDEPEPEKEFPLKDLQRIIREVSE